MEITEVLSKTNTFFDDYRGVLYVIEIAALIMLLMYLLKK